MIHRDVGSANILLESSGSSQWKGKLSDYGSTNILHQIRTVAPGSPAYAAPKAQSSNPHSPEMDVYCLFVEMITSHLPFIKFYLISLVFANPVTYIKLCIDYNLHIYIYNYIYIYIYICSNQYYHEHLVI